MVKAELRKALAEAQQEIERWRAEAERLRAAIRKHESQRGHELCWLNDVELWRAIDSNASYPHESLPVREEFLGRCARYYESRVRGTAYAEPAVKTYVKKDRSCGASASQSRERKFSPP